MKLLYSRIRPNAKAPFRKYPTDAGWDVFACDNYAIKPGSRVLIPTGLAIKLLPNNQQAEHAAKLGATWYWRAADKSGLAENNGVHVLGGVVDRNYRGEVKIIVVNLGFWSPQGVLVQHEWNVKAGDKICQIIPELIADVSEAAEDPSVAQEATDRGSNGFGSTGNT